MKRVCAGKLRGSFRLPAALPLLSACGRTNSPPDSETPEPELLSGDYASEYGTMTFNGDGESIVLDLKPELAETMGLAEGVSEGRYEFLFSGGKYRYDKAETLRVTVGERQYEFLNHHGRASKAVLDLFVPTWGEGKDILFEREKDE